MDSTCINTNGHDPSACAAVCSTDSVTNNPRGDSGCTTERNRHNACLFDPAWEGGHQGPPPPLKPKVEPKVEEAMAFQHPDLIERFAEDNKVTTTEAGIIFEETKKWLILATTVEEQSLAPSKMQDEMWHCWLLFSESYATWCFKHFGQFLHHLPKTKSSPEMTSPPDDVVIAKAKALFGTIEEKYWRNSSTCTSCGEMGCARSCCYRKMGLRAAFWGTA